jgi:DNA processing protein
MTINEPGEDLLYTLSLTYVNSIKASDIKRLLDHFPDSRSIFSSDARSLIGCLENRNHAGALAELILRFRDFDRVKRDIDNARKLNVSVISYRSPEYPKSLRFIPDPPPVIYVCGKILPEDSLAVAIVGTRSPTTYGVSAAISLSRDLASYGVTVVSGLARGIDSASHTETIKSGGRTIAVMANGPDITYPSENSKLRKKIEENGAVITEFPPGTKPDKWRFPTRNRIIAGLSVGCVVVEAPVKSGALITARLAADYNREVFAVPGNITSIKSTGCNKLLKEGASPVTCVEDILEEFEIKLEKKKKIIPDKDTLNNEEKIILDLITGEGILGEMIIQSSDFPSFKVSSLLTGLELKGFVKKLPGNSYIKIGLGN